VQGEGREKPRAGFIALLVLIGESGRGKERRGEERTEKAIR
jgi:hypothetical protein